MIAYEDLVVALTNWRINQGLPTSAVTFLSEDTGSVDLALPVADPLETAQAAEVVDEYAADEYAEEVSADEYAAEEVSADEYAAEEVSADDYAAEEVSADDYAAEEVSADEYAAEEVSADDYAAEEVSADDYAAEEVSADDYAAEEVSADEYAAPAEGFEADAHAASEGTQEVPLDAVEEQADLSSDGYYESEPPVEAETLMNDAAPQTEEVDVLPTEDSYESEDAPTDAPAEGEANFADLEDESTVMNQGFEEMAAPVSDEMNAEDPEEQ